MHKKMRFIQVSGSPYERGKAAGKIFRRSLSEVVPKYTQMLNDSKLYHQMDKIRRKVIDIFPSYYEEVCGRADGAGVCQDTYFLMMCAEVLGEGTGCTSIVYRRQDGSILLSHNEDDNFTADNSCITKCSTESGWFTTSDFHTMPFGNGFSWNSHGIVKTINYCHPIRNNLDGIPRYFAQRHISEASSIEDFIKRCDMPDRASGYHAIAVDMNNHTAVSVEVTADDISVRNIEDVYCHTNHYIHQNICHGKIFSEAGSTSPYRLHKASELLNKLAADKGNEIFINDMSNILQYKGDTFESSILSVNGDPYVTFATFSVDTAAGGNICINFHITKENFEQVYDRIV